MTSKHIMKSFGYKYMRSHLTTQVLFSFLNVFLKIKIGWCIECENRLRKWISFVIDIQVLLIVIGKAGSWTIWRELCGSGDMAVATKCDWFVGVSHSRDHKSSDFLQYFFLKKVRTKTSSLRLNNHLSNYFSFSF